MHHLKYLSISAMNHQNIIKNYIYSFETIIQSHLHYGCETWLHAWETDIFTHLEENGYEIEHLSGMKTHTNWRAKGVVWIYNGH